MIDFEVAFGAFIDRREFDQAENALFSMVRIAFMAGWLAAGGMPPPAQKVFELYQTPRERMADAIEPGEPSPGD